MVGGFWRRVDDFKDLMFWGLGEFEKFEYLRIFRIWAFNYLEEFFWWFDVFVDLTIAQFWGFSVWWILRPLRIFWIWWFEAFEDSVFWRFWGFGHLSIWRFFKDCRFFLSILWIWEFWGFSDLRIWCLEDLENLRNFKFLRNFRTWGFRRFETLEMWGFGEFKDLKILRSFFF